MKNVIRTNKWRITIVWWKWDIGQYHHFLYTFLFFWNNHSELYAIYYLYSDVENVVFKNENTILFYADWTQGIPISFFIFLSLLLYKKCVDDGDVILHGGAFVRNNQWFILAWDSGSGKTSVLINLMFTYWDINFFSNTKTLVDSSSKIIYGTKILSFRQSGLAFYNQRILDYIHQNTIYKNNEWIYVDSWEISNTAVNVKIIFFIKISTCNTYMEIQSIFDKIFLLNQNIFHYNLPIIFSEKYIYYYDFLSNFSKITSAIQSMAHNVKIIKLEWDMNYILDTINYYTT